MRIETFHSGDLNELVDVWNRNLLADPISVSRLESRVLLDPNFREDFCLTAWNENNIIGFILGICGEGFRFPEELVGDKAWILAMAVESEYKRSGIGTALLECLEKRFQDAGKHNIWVSTYPTAYITPGIDKVSYTEGLGFLQAKGYKMAYTAFAMDAVICNQSIAEIAAQKEKDLTAQGFAFYTYSSEWLSAFRRFLRSQVPWDWEWLSLRNLSRIIEGSFSPEWFLLAIFNGDVVGYCQYEGEHFGPFGVAQGFQGKGIGTVLLARALRSMAQQGMHNAWILWTGEQTARLYARFGFKKSREFAILHKEI